MSTNDTAYMLIFWSGLVGGLSHCSGMCGPLVTAWSVNLMEGGRTYSYLLHILYNAGRLTTYSIIGGMMGLTGSFSNMVKHIENLQNITMYAIGVIMILLGAANLGYPFLKDKTRDISSNISSRFTYAITRIISFISETHSPGAFYVIGMATGLMPCGLLYTAYIAAAGAGAAAGTGLKGFLSGLFMMLLFGIGTTPSLILIGRFASLKAEWIRRKLYIASAFFMMTIGALLIYRAAIN